MHLPLFIQYNTLSTGLPFWMASHDMVSEPPCTKYSGHCMRQTNQTKRFQPEACWKSCQTKRRIKQTATRSMGVAYVKKGKNAKAPPNGKHAARFPFWRERIKAANFGCCLCESEDSQVGKNGSVTQLMIYNFKLFRRPGYHLQEIHTDFDSLDQQPARTRLCPCSASLRLEAVQSLLLCRGIGNILLLKESIRKLY